MSTALLENSIIEHTSDLLVAIGKQTEWRSIAVKREFYERKFERGVRKMLVDQCKEVLKNMGQKSKSILNAVTKDADWLFDMTKWRVTFEEFGQYLLPQVIQDRGQEVMGDLVVGVSFDVTDPAVERWVANKTYKFSYEVNAETQKMLRAAFSAGIQEGEGIPQIAKRVRKIYGVDEFQNRARSEMIARTEVLKGSNFAAEQSYIQSGVVEGKEWLNGPNPCDWCAAMNGRVQGLGESYFKLGDSFQVGGKTMKINYESIEYPPIHPRCVCTLIPVLK